MASNEQQLELPIVTFPTTPRGERHMSVDLTGLSNNPGAVVGSLAWIVFDPKDTGGANDSYFKTLDWEQRERGYNWDKIKELMLKNGMARRSIVNFTPPVPLLAAVTSTLEAFNKHGCTTIWGTRQSLAMLENAAMYCKKDVPWTPAQARDLASVWGTASDLGQVADLERHQSEPEDVPLGNAAFVARAVRHLYQRDLGKMPTADSTIKE